MQAGHCQGMTGDGVGVRVGAAADLASTCPRPPPARAWRGRPGGRRCRRPPPPRPSPRPAAPDWALSATGRAPGGGRGPAPLVTTLVTWSHGYRAHEGEGSEEQEPAEAGEAPGVHQLVSSIAAEEGHWGNTSK